MKEKTFCVGSFVFFFFGLLLFCERKKTIKLKNIETYKTLVRYINGEWI